MGQNKKERLVLVFGLFLFYMGVMCYFLFFAEALGRGTTGEYHYNLVPFQEIKRFIQYRNQIGWTGVVLNLLGNIVAFIPFGTFVARLAQGKLGLLPVMLLSMECSLLVEVIQLITQSGCCDIDDVILNTIGGMIGYGLYRLWCYFHQK